MLGLDRSFLLPSLTLASFRAIGEGREWFPLGLHSTQERGRPHQPDAPATVLAANSLAGASGWCGPRHPSVNRSKWTRFIAFATQDNHQIPIDLPDYHWLGFDEKPWYRRPTTVGMGDIGGCQGRFQRR